MELLEVPKTVLLVGRHHDFNFLKERGYTVIRLEEKPFSTERDESFSQILMLLEEATLNRAILLFQNIPNVIMSSLIRVCQSGQKGTIGLVQTKSMSRETTIGFFDFGYFESDFGGTLWAEGELVSEAEKLLNFLNPRADFKALGKGKIEVTAQVVAKTMIFDRVEVLYHK